MEAKGSKEDRSTASALLEAIHLDGDDSTPLYLQVRKGLLKAIRDGVFQPDDALPSERALSELVGISRVTARRAIEELSTEGLIVRRRGSGNYIAPMLEQPLSQLTSFTEELTKRGFKPVSRWLSRVLAPALPDELIALGLSPGAQVARLERIRLASGVPMSYESSVLPSVFLPHPEKLGNSLYDYLAQNDLMPARALQHFRASNATQRHAELLSIPQGLALMDVRRTSYLPDGRVIEVTQTLCRSDYYDFVVELRR
jgi:GntR family transcriptional regulator